MLPEGRLLPTQVKGVQDHEDRAPAILPSNELEEARQTHLGLGPRRRFVEVLALRRVGSCEEERADVVLFLASGCDSACESPASSRSRDSNPERIASRDLFSATKRCRP